MRLYRIIFITLLLVSFAYCEKQKEIIFAPLPTKSKTNIINDFNPLISYLENELNIKIKYKFYSSYKDIIKDIKNEKIDLSYLGPLPYVALYSEYKDVQPLVTFREKDNKHNYKCVLAKFKSSNIDISKKQKVALTQPLSTCGYFMTNILLEKKFSKKLDEMSYSYEMSHENALLSLVKGTHDLAGAKDSIANKYKSLGVSIIKKSISLPGFTFVVNSKKIDNDLSNKIIDVLLNIPQNELKKLKKGSNGFVKTKQDDYGNLKVNMSKIPLEGNIIE